jgi:hypothetical protein
MPKVVEIVLKSQQAKEIIPQIKKLPGVIGLRVQAGVSIQPPGDVISVTMVNRHAGALFQLLDEKGWVQQGSASVTTNMPLSVVSRTAAEELARDASVSSWEEMETVMGKESNTTLWVLLLMGLSGALAVAGLATDALHLVIAAMIIAPGFVPLVRISMGIASGTPGWRRGLIDLGKGYLALLVGAALTTAVLLALNVAPYSGDPAYLTSGGILVDYWSTITSTSILVSLVASLAGAILVSTNRSELTAGVMVALSLVPAAVFVALGAVTGQWEIARIGLLRWFVEAAIVFSVSLAYFFLYRRFFRSRAGWL